MVYFNAYKPHEYYIGVSLMKYTVLISFINGFVFYSPRKNSEAREKLYAVVCLINHSLGVCVL